MPRFLYLSEGVSSSDPAAIVDHQLASIDLHQLLCFCLTPVLQICAYLSADGFEAFNLFQPLAIALFTQKCQKSRQTLLYLCAILLVQVIVSVDAKSTFSWDNNWGLPQIHIHIHIFGKSYKVFNFITRKWACCFQYDNIIGITTKMAIK